MESRSTHHMVKDDSLFCSLSGYPEVNIYVFDEYTLTIIGNGDADFQRGVYLTSIMYRV